MIPCPAKHHISGSACCLPEGHAGIHDATHRLVPSLTADERRALVERVSDALWSWAEGGNVAGPRDFDHVVQAFTAALSAPALHGETAMPYRHESQHDTRTDYGQLAVPALPDQALREKAEAFCDVADEFPCDSRELTDWMVQFIHSLASEDT